MRTTGGLDVLTAVRERDEALAVAAMRSHILAARYVAMLGVEQDAHGGAEGGTAG